MVTDPPDAAAILDLFEQWAPLMRRWPGVEAHDLVAADACDRLVLAETVRALEQSPASEVVVIGDRFGAITLPLLGAGFRIRAHQDALTGERALRANAERIGIDTAPLRSCGLDDELADGATVVAMRIPRSLDALDEIASVVAATAAPTVRVVAGARVKYLTPAATTTLQRHFAVVTATRASGKSRALIAQEPREAPAAWPRVVHHGDLDLTVAAFGSAFAGASVDVGTRLLLSCLSDLPAAASVVDLGCGTGILAASYARRHPDAAVVATDESAGACRSARVTARRNDVSQMAVVRADGGDALAAGSADLVLLNPPFHVAEAVTTEVAMRMFDAAARLLRPGGELWAVWNSHLRYRRQLAARVGPTREVARNPRFTVTASVRREVTESVPRRT